MGISCPYLDFLVYRLLCDEDCDFEVPLWNRSKKRKKGPGNVQSMENKFNETGSDFGKTHSEPKLNKNELTQNSTFRKEQIDKLKFLILLSSNSLKGGHAWIAVK